MGDEAFDQAAGDRGREQRVAGTGQTNGRDHVLGMTPRQTVAMVVTSVAGTGLLAGLVAVPAGVAPHHGIIPLMGDGVGMNLPTAAVSVYDPQHLIPLAFGGLAIAVAGGLLPASWAARTDTATALRSE
ncbi:ABC transporter permease [Streptomyces bobili]|uniref:ABC transporter permease n=1 Tax=Streptomyces bobili TaxID=67280 RepID=UPI0034399B14